MTSTERVALMEEWLRRLSTQESGWVVFRDASREGQFVQFMIFDDEFKRIRDNPELGVVGPDVPGDGVFEVTGATPAAQVPALLARGFMAEPESTYKKGCVFTDPTALAEECDDILTQILNAAPLFDVEVTYEFDE